MATATLEKKTTETPPSSLNYRDNQWDLMKENGWKMGDVLESVEPERDGNHLRIMLRYVASMSGPRLDADGKHEFKNPDGSISMMDGTGRQVVVFAEWPVGARVQAMSLTCREWRKLEARQ